MKLLSLKIDFRKLQLQQTREPLMEKYYIYNLSKYNTELVRLECIHILAMVIYMPFYGVFCKCKQQW